LRAASNCHLRARNMHDISIHETLVYVPTYGQIACVICPLQNDCTPNWINLGQYISPSWNEDSPDRKCQYTRERWFFQHVFEIVSIYSLSGAVSTCFTSICIISEFNCTCQCIKNGLQNSTYNGLLLGKTKLVCLIDWLLLFNVTQGVLKSHIHEENKLTNIKSDNKCRSKNWWKKKLKYLHLATDQQWPLT
jgi:hypothetical protein